jgi:hypothetical protein
MQLHSVGRTRQCAGKKTQPFPPCLSPGASQDSALEIRNGRNGYSTLPAGVSKVDQYASHGEEHTKFWVPFPIRLLILLDNSALSRLFQMSSVVSRPLRQASPRLAMAGKAS